VFMLCAKNPSVTELRFMKINGMPAYQIEFESDYKQASPYSTEHYKYDEETDKKERYFEHVSELQTTIFTKGFRVDIYTSTTHEDYLENPATWDALIDSTNSFDTIDNVHKITDKEVFDHINYKLDTIGDSIDYSGSPIRSLNQTRLQITNLMDSPPVVHDVEIIPKIVTKCDASGCYDAKCNLDGVCQAINDEDPIHESDNKNLAESEASKLTCGKGTIEKNGQCVPDLPDTSPSSKGGGCLIATATYGSELAPQVQQLREIRENSLLQTESGRSFMESFNQFYYSFSPEIADLERENPIFKEAVKIIITPLLSSLSLLNYVEMDSEIEVLGYGISLILLNIGMYFVAPALIVIRIFRIRKII